MRATRFGRRLVSRDDRAVPHLQFRHQVSGEAGGWGRVRRSGKPADGVWPVWRNPRGAEAARPAAGRRAAAPTSAVSAIGAASTSSALPTPAAAGSACPTTAATAVVSATILPSAVRVPPAAARRPAFATGTPGPARLADGSAARALRRAAAAAGVACPAPSATIRFRGSRRRRNHALGDPHHRSPGAAQL